MCMGFFYGVSSLGVPPIYGAFLLCSLYHRSLFMHFSSV